ncbi:uncharacterized protein KY384_001893 [Bacidia gigantensis]|uniref:uncharacterized protein n=1 Tax=Bacidia gigantensis TaxID=2732470 RepID=UPI001D048478|nr:uncharacterized protein KY384_001893 [Bacidia gigantensis]KAG8533110.1 hypothetical protein KY384_001893 [Bacidia gigantensis]
MEASWETLLPNMNKQQHKRSISEKSFTFKKRPRLFTSFKGILQKSNRSTTSIRISKSASELTFPSSNPSNPSTTRTRSLDNKHETAKWTQRGRTPGLDDYLTMDQLEGIWQTHDAYLGNFDVPQSAASYKFVEPVEAPTIIRHQHHSAPVRRPIRNPRPLNKTAMLPQVNLPMAESSPRRDIRHSSQARGSESRPSTPPRREPVDEDLLKDGRLSPVRAPSPLRPRKAARPASDRKCPEPIRAPSPLRPPVPAKDTLSPRQLVPQLEGPSSGWERPLLRPITAPSHGATLRRSAQSQSSPRPVPSTFTEVRDAVVSGIVHPAFRPTPYFDSRPSTPQAVF